MRAHPRAALWLMVFVPLAVLFGFTTTAHTYQLSPDPVAAGVAAWSVAEHGTLDLKGDVLPQNPWILPWHGEVLSNRTPGVIAFGLPAAVLARPFVGTAFSLGPERITGAVVSAAAVGVLALLLLELGATRRTAAVFSMLGAVATSTWSVSADGLWTHGPDQLLLLAAMLALMRRHLWLAGVLLGVGVTVRTHLVFVAAVLGLGLAWQRRSVLPALAFGVPSIGAVGAILLYGKMVFGIWSLSPGYAAYGEQPTAVLHNHFIGLSDVQNYAGTFFSPDRGLFVISPVVLILLLRLRPAWRAAPDMAKWAFVGGLIYLAVQLRLNPFTGGYNFFGYRLILETLTLTAPLLFLAWQTRTRGSDWERAVWATLWLSIGTQILGSAFIIARGVQPYWRHSYILATLDPLAYPWICRVILGVSLLAGILTMLVPSWPSPRQLRLRLVRTPSTAS